MTGRTTHLIGTLVAGELEVAAAPDPTSVEIVEQDEGVYLLRFDQDGECVADTWHETVKAAKAQANLEFEIQDDDWKDAGARH